MVTTLVRNLWGSRFYYHPLSGDFLALRDGSGVLFADSPCNIIHFIETGSNTARVIAGCRECRDKDGDALTACIKWPRFMTFDHSTALPDSVVYIACPQSIRRLNLQTGILFHVRLRL